MSDVLKKILLSFLALIIVASGVMLPQKRAHAELMDTIESFVDKTLLPFLKNVVFVPFKNRIINYYYNATLDMIQNADIGDPQTITSYYDGLLGKATQAAIGDIVLKTDVESLCRPVDWGVQLQISYTQPQPLDITVKCTLNDILNNVQGGVESFTNSFTSGGWLAFTESAKPQNNPWGVAFAARGALFDAQNKQETEAQYDAQDGFISVKRCLTWSRVNGEPNVIVVANSSVAPGTDANGEPKYLYQYSPDGHYYSGKTARPEGSDWQCTQPETTTPGKLIADQMNKALGLSGDAIVNADNFNSLLQGLLQAITARVALETEKGIVSATERAQSTTDCNDPTIKKDVLVYALCNANSLFKGVDDLISGAFGFIMSLFPGGKEAKEAAQSGQNITDIASTEGASTADVDEAVQAAQNSLIAGQRAQVTGMLSLAYISVSDISGLPDDVFASSPSTFNADTALGAARTLIETASSSNENLITLLKAQISALGAASPPQSTATAEGILETANTSTRTIIASASTTNAGYRELLETAYTPAQVDATPSENIEALSGDVGDFLTKVENHLMSAVSQYRTSCTLEKQACTDLQTIKDRYGTGSGCNVQNFSCGGDYYP